MEMVQGRVFLNIPAKWEEKGFATPSGRVEIWPSILEDLGLPALPMHVEPPESPYSKPELYQEYPFILITGPRHLPFTHSEHRQLPSLRRMHPDPIVEIHPQTARDLDPSVWDGDWIWIETPRGKIKQKVRTSSAIHPKVVCAQHCWWFPEKPCYEPSLYGLWESNVNILTDDDPKICGKAMGNWPAKTLLCKIYKA
jgi:anaerobic selenocysteine-containing dehydrogenase